MPSARKPRRARGKRRKVSEKSGNHSSYPAGGSFAELLDWHLGFGTRPEGMPGRPGTRWDNKTFAKAVGGVSDRTVRNWRTGRSPTRDLASIERALFGDNDACAEWRADLRAAHDGRNKPAAVPTGGIPRPPPHFLGRADDVAALVAMLTGEGAGASILVQGGPGIGKTSLTNAVGNDPAVVERFGVSNRWFVALETATSAAAMQDAVIRAVGGDPTRGFDATSDRLRLRPGLLVLDNLETPWDPTGERCAVEDTLAALAAVPGVALLASFRGIDRVGGIAWTLEHHVAELDDTDAADLFCRVAAKDFHTDPHFTDFIGALGGIPLAIELVAAHAHGRRSVADLWTQWQRIGSKLAAHPDYGADRLSSLPHSIELSLQSGRLDAEAHRLFKLLGQLPAGIAAEDRDSLIGDGGHAAAAALLRVGLAVERGDARLDLLPPIRDHAARRYPPVESDAAAWPTHYLRLAQLFGCVIGSTAGGNLAARLLPELPNLAAGFRVLLASGRRQSAMEAIPGFVQLAGIGGQSAPILIELTAACRHDADKFGEAQCLFGQGYIALAHSKHETAHTAFSQALKIYKELGQTLSAANCIRNMGQIEVSRSRYEKAHKFFNDAINLYNHVGDAIGKANCAFHLGDVALKMENYRQASINFKNAKNLYISISDLFGEAHCIKGLGDIALRLSDLKGAGHAFEQALVLYKNSGLTMGEANCILSLGDIARRRLDFKTADHRFREALRLYENIGDMLGQANCFQCLGDAALDRKKYSVAENEYEIALPLYRGAGDMLGEANCLLSLGDIAFARSDHDAAREAYERAMALYRRIGREGDAAICARKLEELGPAG